MSYTLDSFWVSEIGCETGLNQLFPGDEILGLARGFISSGAKNILLTLWRINDKSTKELMESFYNSVQMGLDIESSLTIAQLKAIKLNENPYYWAPFYVI